MEDTHEHDDATMHASAPIADEPMINVGVSQHNLVSMFNLNILVTLMLALEKGFTLLSENVIKMSDFLKKLIHSPALVVLVVSLDGGAIYGTTSLEGHL